MDTALGRVEAPAPGPTLKAKAVVAVVEELTPSTDRIGVDPRLRIVLLSPPVK